MMDCNYRKFLLCFFLLCAWFSLSSVSSFGEETTRYGAVVICSEEQSADPASVLPELSFLEGAQNEGWRLLTGDAYSGFDSHRFFFTVEAPKANLPAPKVKVKWEGVKIARVLGAKEAFESTDDGVIFTLNSPKAPTGSFTEVSIGAVKLGVFHNWNVRVVGPYRDDPYPETQVKAQLNYMLAALEVCRAYGWTESAAPDFVDHINLYGFETNFPNGHRDYPPHFHIMLAWDGWKAANVGHYLLDADGNIIKNNFWSLHEDVEKFHQRDKITPYVDKTDRVVFETKILPDGSGLIFSKLGASDEFLMRAGEKGAADSVEVVSRASNSNGDWKKVCDVKASDDAEHGFFVSTATYPDGTVQKVEFRYDPDTGAKL